MNVGGRVSVLHPVERVALVIAKVQIPVSLAVAIDEFTTDVGDAVLGVIVPDLGHEVEHVVIEDSGAELRKCSLAGTISGLDRNS